MTEKQYAPTKIEKKVSQKAETGNKIEQPKVMTPEQEKKAEKIEKHDEKEENKVEEKTDSKETKTEDKKKKKQPAKKIKKDEVVVNATGLHISTKYAIAICEFIRWKKIEKAIEDLENVLAEKMHVPMRGEYAHKRGKGKVASGAGKYPKYATGTFIGLLKSLNANAMNHDVEEPVIVEAIANFGARPLGRFGRWKRKRTNVKLVAREKKAVKKSRNKTSKKINKKPKKEK